MNLLIVEDDEEAASFIKYVLEQEHYGVETATTATEAREKLEQRKTDLIILDRGLPDADGFEFCREIRAIPRLANIPILFLSADKTPVDIVDGLRAGANDYVTKPFAFIELLARVEALLGHPRAAQ